MHGCSLAQDSGEACLILLLACLHTSLGEDLDDALIDGMLSQVNADSRKKSLNIVVYHEHPSNWNAHESTYYAVSASFEFLLNLISKHPQIDVDGDGQISLTEFKSLVKTLEKERGGLRPKVGS